MFLTGGDVKTCGRAPTPRPAASRLDDLRVGCRQGTAGGGERANPEIDAAGCQGEGRVGSLQQAHKAGVCSCGSTVARPSVAVHSCTAGRILMIRRHTPRLMAV
eukprot:scaffold11959_cov126-Isochrysis_galbana.AAC.3